LITARINERTGQLLVGPNVLWLTQPKFWVGHGPRCSAPMPLLVLSHCNPKSTYCQLMYLVDTLQNTITSALCCKELYCTTADVFVCMASFPHLHWFRLSRSNKYKCTMAHEL